MATYNGNPLKKNKPNQKPENINDGIKWDVRGKKEIAQKYSLFKVTHCRE